MRLMIAATSLALACATACATTTAPTMEGEMTRATIEFDTDVRVDESTLRITWRATNRGERAVYVAAALGRTEDPSRPGPPEGFYGQLDGVRLVLSRTCPALPDGVDVYMPEVPFFARVEPGASYEQQAIMALPVVLRAPYVFVEPTPEEGEAAVVQLEIPVLELDEAERARLNEVEGLAWPSLGLCLSQQVPWIAGEHEAAVNWKR